MNAVSAEGLEVYWKEYQLGRLGFPDLENRVREFIRRGMAGKAINEREAAAACFYAYLRGRLRQEPWRTPGEWEAAYHEELPAAALVWVRWLGNENWQPARWGEAKGFSPGALETVVSRGHEEPPRPDKKQLQAERNRLLGFGMEA
ncbi:MAG: hypothetical protein LBQ14_07825 [Treponema sp.]|jgi:hypothetical protein|nr:hypothetical protein [Treponema sp.]